MAAHIGKTPCDDSPETRVGFPAAAVNASGTVWGGCDGPAAGNVFLALGGVDDFSGGVGEADVKRRLLLEPALAVNGDGGFDGYGARPNVDSAQVLTVDSLNLRADCRLRP